MYVSIKNITVIIRIASNLALKILLKKGSNMTIVIPVFHVIISFSIVCRVSILVEQVSVSCETNFVSNGSTVLNG